MSEECKACQKEFDLGIWVSPQFPDEKVWLFCSEECKKKFLKAKLERIKTGYPKYYEKIKNGKDDYWNKVLEKEIIEGAEDER